MQTVDAVDPTFSLTPVHSFLYIVYASWPRLTIALAVLYLHTLHHYRSSGRCPAIQDVEREVEQAL